MICVLEGCTRERKTGGYRMCPKHFYRHKKFGNPYAITVHEVGLSWIPTELEKAYIAGFFDGEGCFVCSIKKDKGLVLRIDVTNTDRAIIETIAASVGLPQYIRLSPRRSPRHKDAYHFVLNGERARDFTRVILPYLQVKRAQAALFLHLFEFRDISRYWTPEGMDVARDLKALLRRGPVVASKN